MVMRWKLDFLKTFVPKKIRIKLKSGIVSASSTSLLLGENIHVNLPGFSLLRKFKTGWNLSECDNREGRLTPRSKSTTKPIMGVAGGGDHPTRVATTFAMITREG